MFAKNVQSNYIRFDDASVLGVSQSGANWHVWRNSDQEITRFAVRDNETEARAALDELATSVGTVDIG